jgi:hypothetical protein
MVQGRVNGRKSSASNTEGGAGGTYRWSIFCSIVLNAVVGATVAAHALTGRDVLLLSPPLLGSLPPFSFL